MKPKRGIKNFIGKIEGLSAVRAIRHGLVNIIPVLLIGAFALILREFPVDAYKEFIKTFAGGFLLELLNLIYGATFGVLSLYMTFSISRSYMKIKADSDSVKGGAAFASLISFFILAGAYLPGFGLDSTGPKSMFLAILTGLGASALYLVTDRFFRRRKQVLFSSGADREFNRMLSTFLPILVVVITFTVVNIIITRIFSVDSFKTLISNAFNALFSFGKVGFFKGFLFVLLSSVLWFFGIHGSDTLENVMQTYFAPGLAANQAAIAANAAPTTVLTKEFFDCFVLMGGCGSTICLLIAILLFSKSRSKRGLGAAAAFPMIFNINELMVFGLPIIFNPIMLIPFLTVPLICYSSAYLALSTGIVPMITNEVAWTTPIILGGLHATGSAAGALLQLFNAAVGVAVYAPFVRIMDEQAKEANKRNYASFIEYFRKNEAELEHIRLSEQGNAHGEFAKDLCAEIVYGFKRGQLILAYQPQYAHDGSCVGVEALLRWNHPEYGVLYPPLVIKLAGEAGILTSLEEAVMEQALKDRPALLKKYGDGIKLSVNVTGETVVSKRYINFCSQISETNPLKDMNVCIEVTEKATLSFNDDTLEAFGKLREMGFILAIDDFSMGSTSVVYLKNNMFDIIKLDGSLIKGLLTHQNCREIVSSIVQLSKTLDLAVIAECVETEEEKDILHGIGCDIYQGYLYSPAVFLEDGNSK